jgi:hypothetical protein
MNDEKIMEAISADAKWRLLGHKKELDEVSKLLVLPDAASRIATYILERDKRLKEDWAKVGPCGRHPLVVYSAGVGFDGADSYKSFAGYGFPLESDNLTNAGLVRICDMCRKQMEAENVTKQ